MVRCSINNCKNHRNGWCKLMSTTVADKSTTTETVVPVCTDFESIMKEADPEED